MRKAGFNHGFSDAAWEAGKREARQIMYAVAKKQGLIPYSELVAQIGSISLDAHDSRLDHFLGEIASEDDVAGIGLTTVVVVHKTGDQMPGPGFFDMAEEQGRDTSAPVECWMTELKAVDDYWSHR